MIRPQMVFALVLLGIPFSDNVSMHGRGNVAQGDDGDKAGNHIQWQGWDFTWSIRPREGLSLSDVKLKGKSVLKFAALVEIFVPYNKGDPRPEDFGDGIGHKLVELFPGKDCIPSTSACQAFNRQGKEEGKRYVMMHEEATGLSYIGPGGRAYGKMLTLWCTYNLGGYLYIQRWRFQNDGCLMPEIGLTGPLQHTDTGDTSTPYGTVVGKRGDGSKVFAPSHVHNMYFCLDFDIDGARNTVEEFNYVQDKPGSPSGKHSWTPIVKESSRSGNAGTFRSWRVVNNASKNAHGLRRSYELIPGGNGIFRGASDEAIAQAELWVTRYHADEYPAEKQSLASALPKYLNGEAVENQDVVVWYAIHSHHIPRTEDWPGMPVMWVGFILRPRDFLDSSPVRPK